MKIAYISTFPPRECGLATFNNNLVNAVGLNESYDSSNSFIVAMNESDDLQEHNYPPEVKFVIRQQIQEDYIAAAEFINNSNVDACIIQHEFGIYGGHSGVFLLALINKLTKPFITILHTVLKEPDFMQETVLKEIAGKAAKVVVMSKKAVLFLKSIYKIPADKIKIIEHGVPDFEPPKRNPLLETPLFNGRKVLFTFGLISKNKGLETVIKALPQIVERHPDVLYVILGNTHPGVLKQSGEKYRDSLKQLAVNLGVEKNLAFVNKFVSEAELYEYLTAADLYITPYLNEAQITSGTLSYAVGAGAAVVSTPYWHAQELLAEGRGKLFDFKDYTSLAAIVNHVLENSEEHATLKNNAYNYGLNIRWPLIGDTFIKLLENVVKIGNVNKGERTSIIDIDAMPALNLSHIELLTDDTGIIQHAKFGIPNWKEGYCLDDNARALIFCIMANSQLKDKISIKLMPKFLSFIEYMQTPNGGFRNFLSYDKRYLDDEGSEDSFGRAIWALGYLISNGPNNSYKEFGRELFWQSVPKISKLTHIRGKANTIIGLSYYLKTQKEDEILLENINNLAAGLRDAYRQNSEENWNWYEDILTYDNAILPLAMLCHYQCTGNKESYDIALESIAFLSSCSFGQGYLSLIGNAGWMRKHGKNPIYDQQAVDTMAMLLLYNKAYEITKDQKYLEYLHTSYQWFLGNNSLHVPLYDKETNGCADGLQANSLNRNQGAESTLAYFISYLAVLNAAQMDLASSNEPIILAKTELNIV